jgi:hypothetical protein
MSGGGNYDKTWLQRSLNRAAIERAYEAIQVMGRGLPCRVVAVQGSIVTVAFEVAQPPFTLPQVTIPKAEGPWIRSPTQIGDFGLAIPAETSLGAIDGLGAGTASLALQGNLSNVVWLPVASTGFSAVNINAAFVSGPDGVVLQDESGASVFTLTPTSMSFNVAGHSIVINSTGVIIDGRIFLQHEHTGVQPGSSDTGGVV